MIKEKAILLAEALESGKYKQCSGALRINDAFCCLGVACDISGLGKWDSTGVYLTKTDRCETVLPREVKEFFGFASHSGRSTQREIGIEPIELVDLNDSKKLSFKEIAKVIRERWEDL